MDIGDFERCSGTALEAPDGGIIDAESVLGTAIGTTTIECEAGSFYGRVSLSPTNAITGLLIAADKTTDLPF